MKFLSGTCCAHKLYCDCVCVAVPLCAQHPVYPTYTQPGWHHHAWATLTRPPEDIKHHSSSVDLSLSPSPSPTPSIITWPLHLLYCFYFTSKSVAVCKPKSGARVCCLSAFVVHLFAKVGLWRRNVSIVRDTIAEDGAGVSIFSCCFSDSIHKWSLGSALRKSSSARAEREPGQWGSCCCITWPWNKQKKLHRSGLTVRKPMAWVTQGLSF